MNKQDARLLPQFQKIKQNARLLPQFQKIKQDARLLPQFQKIRIDQEKSLHGGHGMICRCVGYYGEEDAPSWRLARPLVFCRTPGACPLGNGYARPVKGIHELVDMRQMKLKSWTKLYAIFAESLLPLNIFSVGIIINPSSLQSKYLWVRYVSELLLHGKNMTVTNAFVDMHAGDWVWG